MEQVADDHPLGLYFQLKPGERADLEVVSAAAIAWVEGLRAAARAVSPDAEIRVEIVDAQAASLNLNGFIKFLEEHIEPHLARIERGGRKLRRTTALIRALAVGLLITAPATYDIYFGDPDFTEEDRAMLRELSEEVGRDETVIQRRKEFYRHVEKDPSITGVGVKERPIDPPMFVVPNTMFPEAGGLWDPEEAKVPDRITYDEKDVILVRPALTHTARAWTFRETGFPEFDATMQDPRVLARGGLPEQMQAGIQLRIRLKIVEENVYGEYRLKRGGRIVERVISPNLD